MAKIEMGALVTVRPTRNEETGRTGEPYIARVSENRSVTEDGASGWYVVEIPETGAEHEALAGIVREIRPIIVPGYNDAPLEFTPEIPAWWSEDRDPENLTPETRWCQVCLADRNVKREYTTLAASDPTAAYELSCGHHTIDL